MIGLYYHNGSYNHGCEAIIRGTAAILADKELTLFSREPESDRQYGLDQLVEVNEDLPLELTTTSLKYIWAAAIRRIFQNRYWITAFTRKPVFDKVHKGDVMLSIGGDNYCYAGTDILAHYHTALRKKGAKTVLWGCSVDPEYLNAAVKADLAKYDLITARESISYGLLRGINPNTYLVPDPAFALQKVELLLPKEFVPGNTVGINVSPLIIQCESQKGVTMLNYQNLIQYILTQTDMCVALIPHVVEPKNDDNVVLQSLYEQFGGSGRICMIKDCNCMELKGYISRCRFFVGARTHATIAAYSSCVPTLVVGYSTKSKGIARDLFGTEEGYVISVQDLTEERALQKHFKWIYEHEEQIRHQLQRIIPSYCVKAYDAGNLLGLL